MAEHSETAAPKHLRVTQGMVEDLLFDPVMAIWIFFGAELDAFQEVRTKYIWFGQDVDDMSGFSSGKTVEAWWCLNLAAILKPDHIGMVVYPSFQQGKGTFWEYYARFGSPLFRAQLGRVELSDKEEEKDRKSNLRGGGMWTQYFRNKSQVMMPAPNFGRDATTLASLRLNWLWLEEANKILGTEGGYSGAMKQLLGRVTRQCFNKEHPVWANRVTYSSTAELGNHPAAKLHKRIEQRAAQGNPRHLSFSFCYKDFSNLICDTGKSFREQYRDQAGVNRVLENNSEEAGLAEVYGFSSVQGDDWFTAEALDGMEELGEKRETRPAVGRVSDEWRVASGEDGKINHGDTEDAEEKGLGNQRRARSDAPYPADFVHYFLGGDPAPAKGPKNDFGALAGLRAIQLPGTGGDSETDYQLDYVYARKVVRHSIEQWSGLIHEKHADFGFARIVLDWGGGGDWITTALRSAKQVVSGMTVDRKPIVEIGFIGAEAILGDLILIPLLRKNIELNRLFPELKHASGDDKLKDWLNTSFQTAVNKGTLSVPKPFGKWSAAERQGWSKERLWCARHLGLITEHMKNVIIEKNDDGSYKITAHNAKVFGKKGRDDFHDAARNAYIGFRCWLTTRLAGMGAGGLASGGVDVW